MKKTDTETVIITGKHINFDEVYKGEAGTFILAKDDTDIYQWELQK